MFTGLVEAVGRVASVDDTRGEGAAFWWKTLLAGELAQGRQHRFEWRLSDCRRPGPRRGFFGGCLAGDLARNHARRLDAGRRVNLERPRADSAIGRAFCVGTRGCRHGKYRRSARGGFLLDGVRRCRSRFGPTSSRRARVTLDGVSLTLASLSDRIWRADRSAHVVAHNALRLIPGAAVNIEADVLGKYVARTDVVAEYAGTSSAWRIE